MSKDVILDRYARLYEIPHQLALLGHEVRGYCLSYQGEPKAQWVHEASLGQLEWQSRPVWLYGLVYSRTMLNELRSFKPDLIIGASDIPHVALAARLGQKLNTPYLLDLYDNFEGFGQARLPGMKTLLRRAVRSAPMVTTTSQALANHVVEAYGTQGTVISMPSTIDHAVFHPRDRDECRKSLGLPVNVKLVGTAGGLYADKGIDALYKAWHILANRDPNLHLVLAGPADSSLPPPQHERVHYLGMLPHTKIAELFASLDVGVIYLRDTVFGRYCFPQKAYEMAACGTPIVAGDVGAMRELLADRSECLYRPDDEQDLARAISAQLLEPTPINIQIEDWRGLIRHLEKRITDVIRL